MIRPFITPAFQPDNTSNTTANRNAGFIPYCYNQKDVPEWELAIANILSQLTRELFVNYIYIQVYLHYLHLFVQFIESRILNIALYIFKSLNNFA